jgi:hypothetical protein
MILKTIGEVFRCIQETLLELLFSRYRRCSVLHGLASFRLAVYSCSLFSPSFSERQSFNQARFSLKLRTALSKRDLSQVGFGAYKGAKSWFRSAFGGTYY